MMKNKLSKRIAALLLASVLTAGLFGGCGSSAASSVAASSVSADPSASTAEPTDTAADNLAKIKERGRIVIGMNAEFAPYEFHAIIDGKDTLAGFDVAMAKEIAADLGVEMEIKELAFDALLTTLGTGQVDILVSALSATEERRKSVDFSDVYFKGKPVALVRVDNVDQFNTYDDLLDKKIGLQLSSLQDALISEQIPGGSFTKIESMNTLFLALESKQVDVIVTDINVSKMAVAVNPNFIIAEEIEIDDSSLNSPGVGVVLAYDDENAALKEQINATIKRLKDSGQMDQFVDDACTLAASINE